MNFAIFLLNFDEFLSEFHEELQKITDILDIFTKLLEKFGKRLEISGFCEEFHSSVSLFSIDSLMHAMMLLRSLASRNYLTEARRPSLRQLAMNASQMQSDELMKFSTTF